MAELQDVIDLSVGNADAQRKVLIYFICGNPGLVEYYRRYLETLADLLCEPLAWEHVFIHGASHDGFEFREDTIRLHNTQTHKPPYSLSEVTDGVISKISIQAHSILEKYPNSRLDVILIGHSVGSYMLLEAITWYQKEVSEGKFYNIIGGICLFPTIVDMFRSDKGRVFKWILPIPGLGLALTGIIRVLQWFMPGVLTAVAKKHTPGPEGWEVTEALAKSDYGIRQVIYMARNELDEIRHDEWHPANLWGVSEHQDDGNGDDQTTTEFGHLNGSVGASRTKLLFLWGHKDYWVHDDTRDGLIAKRHTRGTPETRHWPWMEIVEDKEIPHTFSLDPGHSDSVARKTAEWVEWLVGGKN